MLLCSAELFIKNNRQLGQTSDNACFQSHNLLFSLSSIISKVIPNDLRYSNMCVSRNAEAVVYTPPLKFINFFPF